MSLTIVQPAGYSSSTCGYCSPPGKRSAMRGSFTTGAFPLQLSCEAYQSMIDRGWRRSGTYLYKPDMKKTCCPQYTIRLDALQFKPTPTQRKLMRRFNRFVVGGDDADVLATEHAKKRKGKASKTPDAETLVDSLHSAEHEFRLFNTTKAAAHKFTITLEPASFTEEKFEMYKEYQSKVHNDHDKAQESFTRFLVDSPLIQEDIEYSTPRPAHLPEKYGSYHQLYRMDGELIAMGIIDVLPQCISSVYFVYSTKYAWASLGKLSGLREIALAQEMHAHGVEDMKFQYMGFYVHSCAKMRYKADFQPSYLLDPEDYTWHDYAKCAPLLDKYDYVSFSNPTHFREPAPSKQVIATGSEAAPVLETTPAADAGPSMPPPADAPEAKDTPNDTSGDDNNNEANDDAASEGDVDEPYQETGGLPITLWMDVMLAESITLGQVNCVPAPMHPQWENDAFRSLIVSAVEGFGEDLSREIIFYP